MQEPASGSGSPKGGKSTNNTGTKSSKPAARKQLSLETENLGGPEGAASTGSSKHAELDEKDKSELLSGSGKPADPAPEEKQKQPQVADEDDEFTRDEEDDGDTEMSKE